MSDWHDAYARWLPGAISKGHTQVNDAFRAGYLAAMAEVEEAEAFLNKIRAEERRQTAEDKMWQDHFDNFGKPCKSLACGYFRMTAIHQRLNYPVIHTLPICLDALLYVLYLLRQSSRVEDFPSVPSHEIGFYSRIIGLAAAQVPQFSRRHIPSIHSHKG